MANDIDSTFLNLINQNLGIAHKIARVYFDDPASREDVIQEMMYQLWRSFKSFDNRSKFSTWMYRVCLNTALTHFTRAKRTQSESLATHHQNIPDVGNDDDEMNTLFVAISTLSKLDRAIVLLYLEDMSYDEIAVVTGLSHGNVSVRLFRIRKKLEAVVKRLNH
jgi:RNA polymerase sigma factor (sigma-70 family)